MNLFRLSVIAVSAALTFSIGSSASTANTHSHPQFTVTENRTLNLQETGSKIIVETIENALRAGGLALLGEGFQLDSSLSYHSGDNEGIEGELDVVVPLWNGGRHVVFAQPGAVFWTGLAEEERIDGNIGLVYRAELTRDLVAGASVFYDHDFQIGHSRVSGGLDLQSQFFRLGANYYHVLSEIEDGREGFVEEAVDGMDARLVFERDVVRFGSTIGYWDYEDRENAGGEDSQGGWKTSIGLDAGVRILPGVFAEASWERHKDELVLDERIFAGLAFRFSLPDFEGASYGDGLMSANLYKIVDREKRILYEEWEADGILLSLDPDSVIEEGEEVSVSVQLREPSAEDVTINLVGSGSATYGTDSDWVISVDGGTTNCSAVTGTSCQITITAGETSVGDNVVITINDDGGGEGVETIILSTTVASGDAGLTSRPLALTIPVDPPLPTVSLSTTDSSSIREGGTATITLTLSDVLGSDATFNLIGRGTEATYGASNDWNLDVGGTDCDMASESSPCQVTISQGDTTATVTFEANMDSADESPETATVSVTVDSVSIAIVQLGNSSSLDFSIQDPLPTVSFNYSGSETIPEFNARIVPITLEGALGESVTLDIIIDGTAEYGVSNDFYIAHRSPTRAGVVFDHRCEESTGCQVTISAGDTSADLQIVTSTRGTGKTINVSIRISPASRNLIELGASSSLEFSIISE